LLKNTNKEVQVEATVSHFLVCQLNRDTSVGPEHKRRGYVLSLNVWDKGEHRRRKQGDDYAPIGIAYHFMARLIPGGNRTPVKTLASEIVKRNIDKSCGTTPHDLRHVSSWSTGTELEELTSRIIG
jgi:hypothetical protein